ncbi:MAG TPA: DUF488 domain-containing protein [Methanomicrobiales archaeon]|nr:DUF488 domain-containing protein [Methanomicrobiales archaeon]
MIRVKRVYDPPSGEDGERILVDRLWPRGLSKERARVDLWLKEVAPTTELRTWYGHDPARWDEFRRRYRAELSGKQGLVRTLREKAAQGTVTLVYSSRELHLNNAVALTMILEGGEE